MPILSLLFMPLRGKAKVLSMAYKDVLHVAVSRLQPTSNNVPQPISVPNVHWNTALCVRSLRLWLLSYYNASHGAP